MTAHLNDAPPGHHLSYKSLHTFGQAPLAKGVVGVGVVYEIKVVFLVRLFTVYLI